MAITSIQQAVDTLTELRTSYVEIQDRLSVDLPTRANFANISASLGETLTTARTLRADLQALDENTLISVIDGGRQLAIWSWRRDTSSSVMQFIAQAQAWKEQVDSLLEGLAVSIVTVKDGDTLQDIAARELGDWREWPRLVEANPGLDAEDLVTGTRIVIPPLT